MITKSIYKIRSKIIFFNQKIRSKVILVKVQIALIEYTYQLLSIKNS